MCLLLHEKIYQEKGLEHTDCHIANQKYGLGLCNLNALKTF